MTAFLRPAVEADLNQIVQIERASFADPWTEESFRRLLGGPPAIFQVIGYPPVPGIAGYVIAFSVGEDAELLNVAVEPKFRGRGLAGQMLDAVLIELRWLVAVAQALVVVGVPLGSIPAAAMASA